MFVNTYYIYIFVGRYFNVHFIGETRILWSAKISLKIKIAHVEVILENKQL